MKVLYLKRSSNFYDTTDVDHKLAQLVSNQNFIAATGRVYSRTAPAEPYKNIFPIPAYNNTAMSFADVTDLAANKLMEKAESNHLPIVVYWSGGIDSTLILSAIVKNFTPALLNRVIVKLTNKSYFENPLFFHNVIKKYGLKYSSRENIDYDYTNAIIVHGDPADSQWVQGNVLNMHKIHPEAYNFSLGENRGVFLDWLRSYSSHDDEYLEWIIDYVINDQTPNNVSIETFSDFYWWLNFNYNLPSKIFQHVSTTFKDIDTPGLLDDFLENFVPWFASDEYQLWAIHNRHNDLKYSGTIRSYKMPAKEYIYDLDRNQHYRDYKTKTKSIYNSGIFRFNAIYEDGTILKRHP